MKSKRGFTPHLFLVRHVKIIFKYFKSKTGLQKGAGFTLIELLVVISIVGLISSIVVVNTRGAVGGAQEKSALQFSHMVQNILGAYAVGVWSFEETAGNTAFDSSGYKNDGTIGPGVTKGVSGISGKAFQFSSSGYVTIPTQDLDNERGTIEMWLKPDFDNQTRFIFSTGSFGKTLFSMGKYLYWYDRITYCDVSNLWKIDKWHHIVVSWAESGVKIYVNGKDCGIMASSYVGPFSTTSRIGKTAMPGYSSYGGFSGVVDEIRVYTEPLQQK